jgi:hypothetical protein
MATKAQILDDLANGRAAASAAPITTNRSSCCARRTAVRPR